MTEQERRAQVENVSKYGWSCDCGTYFVGAWSESVQKEREHKSTCEVNRNNRKAHPCPYIAGFTCRKQYDCQHCDVYLKPEEGR